MASQNRQVASSAHRQQTRKQQAAQKHNRQVTSTAASAPQEQFEHARAITADVQQSILDVFTQAFPIISQPEDFKRVMQEVKGHLYNRDFLTAFGKPQYLEVYASRWSAARALAYADIFVNRQDLFRPRLVSSVIEPSDGSGSVDADICDALTKQKEEHTINNTEAASDENIATSPLSPTLGPNIDVVPPYDKDVHATNHSTHTSNVCLKVVCIGGGAGAEVVALAATNRYQHLNVDDVSTRSSNQSSLSAASDFNIVAVDIADWSNPLEKLSSSLTKSPPIPMHTSQALRDSNHALLQPGLMGNFTVSFRHQDVLQTSLEQLKHMLHNVAVVTIMFTLNELFSTSLSGTTSLLLRLTEAISIDAHMVVVDSPGSYSQIQLGKSSQTDTRPNTKKYPMKWLLDHTLLEVAGTQQDARWIKIEDEESKWFRINDKLGLKYGIDLENCRYQIHVFKKLR